MKIYKNLVAEKNSNKMQYLWLWFTSFGLSLVPASVFALEEVILSFDTGSKIVGTSIRLEDGAYAIETPLGEFLIDPKGVECLGASCPDLKPTENEPRPPVTLRERNGGAELSGRLIALEDGAYILDTALGELRISADRMTCEGKGCPQVTEVPRFVVHADGVAMSKLIPALLKGYADTKRATIETEQDVGQSENISKLYSPDKSLLAEVILTPASDTEVFATLDEGIFDVGFTQRRMNTKEASEIAFNGYGDIRGSQHEALLALDAITVITDPTSKIRSLSTEDLMRIWSGDITNWRQLGGRNLPIKVHGYSDLSENDFNTFWSKILPDGSLLKSTSSQTHENSTQLVSAVVSEKGAIGVSSRAAALDGGGRLVSLRSPCGLLASPSSFGVKIGNYPMGRSIYAYTRPSALHPIAREFVEWSQSKGAQDIIGMAGFANTDLDQTGIENMGMMLVHTATTDQGLDRGQFSSLMRELKDANRLSLAFRFQSGSSILDADSIANISELADRIEANDFLGQEVLLVGFADNVGSSKLNIRLAEARSQAVLEILERELSNQALGETGITPLGFGEQLPMACNDFIEGRNLNRRVEVWTRMANSTLK